MPIAPVKAAARDTVDILVITAFDFFPPPPPEFDEESCKEKKKSDTSVHRVMHSNIKHTVGVVLKGVPASEQEVIRPFFTANKKNCLSEYKR